MSKYFIGLGENKGIDVEESQAFEYALKKCGIKVENEAAPEFQEFKEAMVDWYFSGAWFKEG